MSERDPRVVYKHVREFVTEASVEMLNAALADRRIRTERILSLIHI